MLPKLAEHTILSSRRFTHQGRTFSLHLRSEDPALQNVVVTATQKSVKSNWRMNLLIIEIVHSYFQIFGFKKETDNKLSKCDITYQHIAYED